MKNIKLYNDDCLNTLKELKDDSVFVDCIICDLPYYSIVSDEFDNQWESNQEYLSWVRLCIERCYDLLKDGGNILLFCSRQNMWRVCEVLDSVGFIENRTIIWARKRGFNNTRGRALTSGYEPILFWSKNKSQTFNTVKIAVESKRPEYITGSLKDGVNLSDVWADIPALPHNSKEKVKHPTQKPVKLMERIVSVFSNPEDVILDFCMGSGSTGVACLNLCRRFIGIEKNKLFFDIAQKRLNLNALF